MAKVLVLDLSRLLIACLRPTPRGIERVDHALALELCEGWHGDLFGLLWTPLGGRIVDRIVVRRLLDHVARAWNDHAEPGDDPVFTQVRNWLRNGELDALAKASRATAALEHARRITATIRDVGLHAGRPLAQVAAGATIVVLGHLGLAAPGMPGLLERRDLRLAVLVHDMLSLSAPQFFPAANEAYFRKVFDRSLRDQTLFLATTQHVRGAIQAHLQRAVPEQTHEIAIISVALAFGNIMATPPYGTQEPPYFVICATREPRKNHLLLLNIWRDLARLSGTPRLIMVGGRGWNSDIVEAILARSALSGRHILAVEGLGTAGLRALMRGACSLLSPSFAEGYGLPVVEALLAGTPVIASDLPVYAETTAGLAQLLHPLDGPGWQKAILQAAAQTTDAHRTSTQKTVCEAREKVQTTMAATLKRHPSIISVLSGDLTNPDTSV